MYDNVCWCVLAAAVSSRPRWPSDPHYQSRIQTLQVSWDVSDRSADDTLITVAVVTSSVSICILGCFLLLLSCRSVFSKRELMFTFTICCRPSVCLSVSLSSVMLVHPTVPVEIFGNVLRHLIPWPSVDIQRKFYRDRPRETRLLMSLNASGVGPVKCCILEMVQGRR